ncbi:beta-defensin 37-like [Arvicanthis niloticus]|uniref:beta-defensin 37-like n=1 Tax=Arvicanthis niloticus TaxID=61156 RepID=UPI00148745C9|nr:beta-defensin 37-like [Arvicanthis niloticus]
MKICFLLLIVSLSSFQNNPVAVLDTIKCIKKKNTCHIVQCPYFHDVVGTCYEGKGKCCHKRC